MDDPCAKFAEDWVTLCASKPTVYMNDLPLTLKAGCAAHIRRMLGLCGWTVKPWSAGQAAPELGPNEYIVCEYQVLLHERQGRRADTAKIYSRRTGRHKIVIQSEPLSYESWPERANPTYIPDIACILEYTPSHVVRWCRHGVPCVFYPNTWHAPIAAPLPLIEAMPKSFDSCFITGLQTRRKEIHAALLSSGSYATIGAMYGDRLKRTISKCGLGVLVRKQRYIGPVEVHRITGFMQVHPCIAWIAEEGLDNDLWSQVFPFVQSCPYGNYTQLCVAVKKLLQDGGAGVKALLAASVQQYQLWYEDWAKGGLGMPPVLYDAMPWLQTAQALNK